MCARFQKTLSRSGGLLRLYGDKCLLEVCYRPAAARSNAVSSYETGVAAAGMTYLGSDRKTLRSDVGEANTPYRGEGGY